MIKKWHKQIIVIINYLTNKTMHKINSIIWCKIQGWIINNKDLTNNYNKISKELVKLMAAITYCLTNKKMFKIN